VAAAAGLTYISDFLYLRLKMANKNSTEAFGSVQFFPATQLKNGKLDIYIESPQTETCVHTLFPHYGYNPCWYAKRNQVHVVAQITDPATCWEEAENVPLASRRHLTETDLPKGKDGGRREYSITERYLVFLMRA
jgi:hypothetical protein